MATNLVQKPHILESGYQFLLPEAGVDEAGRGCLAGPVFAAAVILPPDFSHPELNDSKKLSPAKRNLLRTYVEKEALAWAVCSVSAAEIDEINILQASVKAMHLALQSLSIAPGFIAIDGNYFRSFQQIPHKTFVKGDGRFMHIAAASILAKTHRDEYMKSLHEKFPVYEWHKNKGYGSARHIAAIKQFGLSTEHRKSFRLKPKQLSLQF